MTIDKVYVVERTYSDFGEVWHSYAGVFTNPLDAEELKHRLNAEAQAVRDESPKYPEDGLFETDDAMHGYYEFWRKNPEYKAWAGAQVVELPVNVRIPITQKIGG